MLGDGCREPSSAHRSSALPATNPAECIWQQYARQQIAATYHATCPVHAAVHTTVSKQPGYLLPLMPPWRYRRGTTAKSYRRVLPPARLPLGQPTCRACCRNLPPRPTCRSYRRAYRLAYRRGATAEALPQKTTVVCYRRGTTPVQPTRRGILPRDGSRAQRAGDSDVGANDKGAGDDPGDWVDAH